MKYVAIVGVVLVVVGTLFALSVSLDSPKKIGISTWGSNEDYELNIQGFQDALKSEFGDEEIEFIIKNPNADKLAQVHIMNYFDDQNVDLIYTLTTPGTKIAQEIFNEKPIVFSIVTFPVEAKIVDSMKSSKNNLVGTSNYIDVEEQMKKITENTDVKELAFVHRTHEVNSLIQLSLFENYSEKHQISLIDVSASNLEELEERVNFVIDNVDGVYLACDTLIQTGGDIVTINIATENKKPSFSCVKSGVENGAVFGVVADNYRLGYESGLKAVQILNGEHPSNIQSSFSETQTIFVNKEAAELFEINFEGINTTWEYAGVLEK